MIDLKKLSELEYEKNIFVPTNWNAIEDQMDKITYERVTAQFWLATRMPVGKDVPDWRNMPQEEKDLVARVFVGLTVLDTLQSEVGVDALKPYARTPHEIAVYNNFGFMESEHTKSYSSIFSTLNTNREITSIFEWAEKHESLQKKTQMIEYVYKHGDKFERKIASVYLESFLFYSGFYTPLHMLGNSKLINSAEVIKLIIRDESIHGSYIGYKFWKDFQELDQASQEKYRNWAYEFLYILYENECDYTEYLYDSVGWTEDVKTFVRYNANKALANLRFDPLFPDVEGDVNPIVLNGLSTGTTNHDFFSSVGNGYLMSVVEDTEDEDYEFMNIE